MTRDNVLNAYFDWLFDVVCGNRFSQNVSYRKLLMYLHSVEFRYVIRNDANRAREGIGLRYRFAYEHCTVEGADLYLDDPCSVLEMMVALALHCEEHIMDDPAIGNRTGEWFWRMVTNMGLGSMSDNNFDKRYVRDVVERFLDRDYEPDGRGGLFRVKNPPRDLRTVEIWYQFCWYLRTIT